jgi:hypothetical protein
VLCNEKLHKDGKEWENKVGYFFNIYFRKQCFNIKQNIQNYNFPVFLYGCETWSLTLREEYRLRVFDKRVLRRIFEPKRNEETGSWRKLHNEDLYSSPSIIKTIKSRRMT